MATSILTNESFPLTNTDFGVIDSNPVIAPN
jgi:hypothetical protein